MIESLTPEEQMALDLVADEFTPESIADAHAALVEYDLGDLLVPTVAAAAITFKMGGPRSNWKEKTVLGLARNLADTPENAEKLATLSEAIARLQERT